MTIVKSEPIEEPISEFSNHEARPDASLSSTMLGRDDEYNNYNNNYDDNNDADFDHDDDADLDDDDDPIVREIDVYLSPQLTENLHLIQYPLVPSAKPRPGEVNPHPSLPMSARYKPNHSILEVEYPISGKTFSSQRQVPAALNLQSRRMKSERVEVVTHMAIGVLRKETKKEEEEEGGRRNHHSRMDLIPLNHILQLRPSLAHVDALFMDDNEVDESFREEDSETNKRKKKQSSSSSTEKSNPLAFQRPESERAQNIRTKSYAYQKSLIDGEEWTELEIAPYRGNVRMEALRLVKAEQDVDLQFVTDQSTMVHNDNHDYNHNHNIHSHSTNNDCGKSYVQTLNYVPGCDLNDVEEEEAIPPVLDNHVSTTTTTTTTTNTNTRNALHPEERRKMLVTRVVRLLQNRGGVPLPYATVRERFPKSTVSDYHLIEALSHCATLVRGNFVPLSSLTGFRSSHVVDARDFLLILFRKYGVVRRDLLLRTFGLDAADVEGDASVKEDRNLGGRGILSRKMGAFKVVGVTDDNNNNNNRNHDNDDYDHHDDETMDDDKFDNDPNNNMDECRDKNGSSTSTSTSTLTADILNSILESIGQKTVNGFEMKIQDDLTFESKFGTSFTQRHDQYWNNREMALEAYLDKYETYMEKCRHA